jgi:hypothetical protein
VKGANLVLQIYKCSGSDPALRIFQYQPLFLTIMRVRPTLRNRKQDRRSRIALSA